MLLILTRNGLNRLHIDDKYLVYAKIAHIRNRDILSETPVT